MEPTGSVILAGSGIGGVKCRLRKKDSTFKREHPTKDYAIS